MSQTKIVDVSCSGQYKQENCYIKNFIDNNETIMFNITNADQWNNANFVQMEGDHSVIMPLGIFQQLPKVKILEIVGSHLKVVKRENFVGATLLQDLLLSNNQIENIPRNLFAHNTPELAKVSFSFNQISVIESFAFNGTHNLKRIDLNYNLLTKIERNTFAGTTNLKVLSIGDNKIASIDDGVLDLPQVECLYLNDNLIESISQKTFSRMPSIRELYLERNKIKTIPTNLFIENAINITVITFDGNEIYEIEHPAFNGCNNLETLYIRNNLLTKLNRTTFHGAKNLKILSLSGNRIEVIEDGTFDLPSMQEIHLSYNPLKMLSESVFKNSPSLRHIQLIKSSLTRVGSLFNNLRNLTTLCLSDNKWVDLNFYSMARRPNLKQLYLKNVGLHFNETLFTANESYPVEVLRIAQNNLTQPDILDRLKNFKNLKVLDISYNNFSVINKFEIIEEMFPKLSHLLINGNEFDMDLLNSMKDKFDSMHLSCSDTTVVFPDV